MSFSPPEVSSQMLGESPTPQNQSPCDTTNSTDDATAVEDDTIAAEEDDSQFQVKKRQKTSKVWLEFKEVDFPKDGRKAVCNHCNKKLAILKSKSTSHLTRHLTVCLKRMIFQKQQRLINFQASEATNENDQEVITPALTDGKFDMAKMREAMAHWILMHEHPFTIVEEEGFNMMQRRGMPMWEKVSRNTIKKDCEQVYEIEKKKLKSLLKGIGKISLTTDMWRSTNQKLEYMVLTGHFIDSNWKLQKRVLNFVHLPPPHRGVEIADCIYKCTKEWGIENKVYTLSVDNASNNDSAIRTLKDSYSRHKKLLCGGKLFHVRCCAHILNLMVQDGLSKIENITGQIHDSVNFINYNEARLMLFSEIVQQLQLPHRKLILECKTRWNSTYEMLSTAVLFKEVFPRYKEREPRYQSCPSNEDWVKVEKLIPILRVCNSVTNIISRSEYPTSNLFLNEICRIKILLDKIH